MADRAHDPVLDGEHQTLLLIRRRTDADGRQELPHVNVLARVDAAGEDVRQARLDDVEEVVECRLPALQPVSAATHGGKEGTTDGSRGPLTT
jgi:hypothetical protein